MQDMAVKMVRNRFVILRIYGTFVKVGRDGLSFLRVHFFVFRPNLCGTHLLSLLNKKSSQICVAIYSGSDGCEYDFKHHFSDIAPV